jgi:hypothetical protein
MHKNNLPNLKHAPTRPIRVDENSVLKAHKHNELCGLALSSGLF